MRCPAMSKKEKFERLAKMREEAKLGGGEERIQKQHLSWS
jgi:hypothetical protein